MKNIKLYGAIILILFLTASIVTVNIQAKKIKAQKAEIERVQTNYKVAQDSIKLIKGENNLLASRIEAQSLTMDELKLYYSNIIDDIKDMKIQLRKVTGVTAYNTETTNNINTVFRDSTVIDTVPIQTLTYSSRWIDLNIVKSGLNASINVVSRDSIVNVIHWNRTGKFWPTRFLTKKVYEQDIKSFNPDSKITFAKWIEVIKKK